MTRLKYTTPARTYEQASWRHAHEFTLHLCPFFDAQGDAQYIDIEMKFDVANLSEDDDLFRHTLTAMTTPSTQYDVSDIEVSTRSGGEIQLYSINDPANPETRLFRVRFALHATQLTVKYRANARKVSRSAGGGAQIALEKDGGGLSGCGEGFLLGLATPEAARNCSIRVRWDLSDVPDGTRAVCSFGEGDDIQFVKNPAVLVQTFFMIGKVKSYPETTVALARGFYWLSQPNFDPVELGSQLDSLVSKMQTFFKDSEPLFRVFCRHHEYKCTSGMGLHQGFVFGWNDIFPKETDGNLEFIVHELIHNWPRLGVRDPSGVPTPEEAADGWFNEGIAEYYALLLPYRMGLETRESFVQRFNVALSGYYTNPARAAKNRDVNKSPGDGFHHVRVRYQRGLMFFLKLTCQLHAAGKRSFDTLIYIMVKLRRTGQPHGIKVWLALVAGELGPSAYEDYDRMSNAELIRLPADCMQAILGEQAQDLVLGRQDQEEFYLGFPEDCLWRTKGVVKDLDLRSRAAEAGAREGDVITDQFSYLFDAEKWNKMFFIKVGRGDIYFDLTWWPRSYQKVESYRFYDVSDKKRQVSDLTG